MCRPMCHCESRRRPLRIAGTDGTRRVNQGAFARLNPDGHTTAGRCRIRLGSTPVHLASTSVYIGWNARSPCVPCRLRHRNVRMRSIGIARRSAAVQPSTAGVRTQRQLDGKLLFTTEKGLWAVHRRRIRRGCSAARARPERYCWAENAPNRRQRETSRRYRRHCRTRRCHG